MRRSPESRRGRQLAAWFASPNRVRLPLEKGVRIFQRMIGEFRCARRHTELRIYRVKLYTMLG